jgi:hypothetical protein
LKRVFSLKPEAVKLHIPALKKGIFAAQRRVTHLYIPASPAKFG